MIDRISTHILNTTLGVPALGVPGVLERLGDDGWVPVGAGSTDADGRIGRLNGAPVEPGDFRITLDTAEYFAAVGPVFYPTIVVTVRLDGARPHYHLPVLAGTFSYSSYLGS
jgi:5-hydroxyisourate hydrolase